MASLTLQQMFDKEIEKNRKQTEANRKAIDTLSNRLDGIENSLEKLDKIYEALIGDETTLTTGIIEQHREMYVEHINRKVTSRNIKWAAGFLGATSVLNIIGVIIVVLDLLKSLS